MGILGVVDASPRVLMDVHMGFGHVSVLIEIVVDEEQSEGLGAFDAMLFGE